MKKLLVSILAIIAIVSVLWLQLPKVYNVEGMNIAATQDSVILSNSETQKLELTPTLLATLELVAQSSEEAETCHETQGQIVQYQLTTPYFIYPFYVRVYLPPCYDSSQDSYPVLYMLHGQSYTDDQWERMGIAAEADRMIAEGSIPPLLVVMPKEENTLQDDKESKYSQALVETLLPWVDQKFRTLPIRECRAIGGLSRGAAWAMRVGLTHTPLFSAIGTHSYAPFPGDFYEVPYWLQDMADGELPRIYMDIGTLDFMMNAASIFEDRLTKYQVPHQWIINTGTHNEEYWSSHIPDYLIWYTFPWKENCSQ